VSANACPVDELCGWAYTGEEVLEILNTWMEHPEPAALQLELRGVTLHYPNGLTSKQFNQLIDYSTVLGTGAFPTH